MHEIVLPARCRVVGHKFNTKKLVVVLECLKDRAFDSADCLRSFVIIPLARSVVEFGQRFVGPT